MTQQSYLSRLFAPTIRYPEERKYGEEASSLKLQVVSFKNLDSDLSYWTTKSFGNVSEAVNNKRSICETRDGAEHFSKTFWKLAKALLATNTEVYHGVLVQEKRSLQSFFTCYGYNDDLIVFPGEQFQGQLSKHVFGKIDD